MQVLVNNHFKWLLIALVFFIQSYGIAGWVIVQKNSFADGNQSFTRIYIQNQKYIVQEENKRIVFDTNDHRFSFVDDFTQKYWKGAIDSIRPNLIASLDSIIKEQFSGMTVEEMQRFKPIKDRYIEQVNRLKPDTLKHQIEILPNSINDDKMGEDSIYSFLVKVDNQVVENFWINPNYNLGKEISWEELAPMLDVFYSLERKIAFRSNPLYIKQIQRGTIARKLDVNGVITEIISIEQKQIDATKMEIPANYKKSVLIDLFSQ
ncbi:MAG: hypothetical protein JW729_04845 [Bacteroidales bacterium]|nr:hypothetical protein [Bacteroidales bacterium]